MGNTVLGFELLFMKRRQPRGDYKNSDSIYCIYFKSQKKKKIMSITGNILKMKQKYITLHLYNDRRLVFVPRILFGSCLCKHPIG